VEKLFSLLGLYQLLAVLLPGAVTTAGVYFAINGLPPDPTAAAVLGLIVLFYVVGSAVQGVAVAWEVRYWDRRGGWPSARRLTPDDAKAYNPAFRKLFQTKLDALFGSATADLPIPDRFALARAELRRRKLDDRAESHLSRGLVTAAVIIVATLLVATLVHHAAHRNLIAAAIIGAAVVPIFHRFKRFGWYFADQVWRDFVALVPAEASDRVDRGGVY
jgi:hypothetical protein